MKWGEIQHRDHGRQVRVWADSTPDHPHTGEGPYIGRIQIGSDDAIPLLREGDKVHYFAAWWQVEFIAEYPT